MPNIFLDIETVGCQNPDLCEYLTAAAKVPGQYKKQDSIDKWREENAAKIISNTALDGAFGEIVAIGWAVDDGEAKSIVRDNKSSEKELLTEFFASISIKGVPSISIVGHNLVKFDLPFIWKRCIVNGIDPSYGRWWFPLMHSDHKVEDTMQMWCGKYSRGDAAFISLDKLCAIFGIESPKGEMDGSKVEEAWLNGEYDKIAEYNKRDIVATRNVYRKLTFQEV